MKNRIKYLRNADAQMKEFGYIIATYYKIKYYDGGGILMKFSSIDDLINYINLMLIDIDEIVIDHPNSFLSSHSKF